MLVTERYLHNPRWHESLERLVDNYRLRRGAALEAL
jgi:hypothetical protein